MRLLPQGFRGRLLATLLCLIIAAQLVTAALVLQAAKREAFDRAQSKLEVGSRVLHQVIDNRKHLLLDTVTVLSDDFGFRSAVATGDKPTIRSVLANHGNRVGASLALLTDPGGRLVAEVPVKQKSPPRFPFPDLLRQAKQKGQAAAVAMYRHKAYLIVLVPVRAPEIIAWVGVGFELDRSLADALNHLTQLDVSFWGSEQGRRSYLVSTLGPAHFAAVDRMLRKSAKAPARMVSGTQFLSMPVALAQGSGHSVEALLSLRKRQILAGYRSLQVKLLILFGATLFFSVLAAVWVARSIGRPILALSRFAQRIGAGEAVEDSGVREAGEVGLLARTMQTLQEKVREREARIRFQSRHDSLTGLPNRVAMEEWLSQEATANQHWLALRFSLREFREINDTLGYRMGDEVLISTALRVRAAIEAPDFLARIGGNEFMAILQLPAHDQALAEKRIETLRGRIEKTIQVMDSPLHIHIAAGGLFIPHDASSLNRIWRRSTIALNHSSDLQGRTCFYQQGMDEHHLRELTIIRDLAPALESRAFYMLYQPKVRIRDGSLIQFEALIRWQHPELGFVSPEEFIDLAERSGQIREMTGWVLGEVIGQLTRWWQAGLRQGYGVAINLSAYDLTTPQLVEELRTIMGDSPVPAGMITLEVTEGAVIRNLGTAIDILNALKAMGFRLSVDDFGTGYSSLAQLKRLPVDEVKIDKSFVLKLDSSDEDQVIVRSTVELGHNLGLSVVAEGVEDAASWRRLAGYGCDSAQGYWIAKPMPVDAIASWLEDFRQRHQEQVGDIAHPHPSSQEKQL